MLHACPVDEAAGPTSIRRLGSAHVNETNSLGARRGRSTRGVLNSTFWLATSQATQALLGAAVSILVARYLRPGDFGLLTAAMAMASLVGAVGQFGLNPLLVREMVRRPQAVSSLLITALALRLGGALAGVLALALFGGAFVADPRASEVLLVTSLALLPQALIETLQAWFQSRTEGGPPALMALAGFFVASLTRLGLLLAGASVLWFAAAVPLAACVTALGLSWIFLARSRGRVAWQALRFTRFAELARTSWPLALAQVAGVAQLRIDQVMVATISGTSEAGLYAAALRLSEVWYLIPGALFISLRPALTRLREKSRARYSQVLQSLFSAMTALALVVAVPVTFLALPIMNGLYGPAYLGGAAVLSIHIWSALFVFWRDAQWEWLLLEGHLRFITVRSLVGALANVALNLALIPSHGAIGAAIATLVSGCLAVVGTNLFFPPARGALVFQLRSLRLAGLGAGLTRLSRTVLRSRLGAEK